MLNTKRCNRRGFTLIEMMCVVVIFAIAAAMVFAGMSSQSDFQAESAARSVMADLLYAQNRAIATQTPVYVYFNTAASNYCLYSPWGTYVTNPVTHDAYTNNWATDEWYVSGVTLGSSGDSALYFDVLGRPYGCSNVGTGGTLLSTTSQIVITSGSKHVTITIQPNTGDMTVQ